MPSSRSRIGSSMLVFWVEPGRNLSMVYSNRFGPACMSSIASFGVVRNGVSSSIAGNHDHQHTHRSINVLPVRRCSMSQHRPLSLDNPHVAIVYVLCWICVHLSAHRLGLTVYSFLRILPIALMELQYQENMPK